MGRRRLVEALARREISDTNTNRKSKSSLGHPLYCQQISRPWFHVHVNGRNRKGARIIVQKKQSGNEVVSEPLGQ